MIHELRHYVPAPGKAEALAARFRDHVFDLIRKFDLQLLDYWEDASGNGEIWYVMAWEDEDAMRAGWDRFRDDERWLAAKRDSEVDGVLVAHSRSIVLRRPNYYRPA